MAQRFAHTLTPRSTSVAAGAAVWLAAGQTIAQSPAELDALLNKTTHIVRTEMAPVIDGALDEDAWESAVRVDDFYESQPNEYAEASEYTEFLLMYDDDNLYIGIRAADSEPELVLATDLRQGDQYTQGDWAGVMIDPFNNKRSGFWFGINPNNVRLDGIFENPTQRLWDWEGIYFARARQTDEGWEGEMSIPFKTLSFDPEIQTWGMNFGRSVRRRNERINWVSRNQDWGPSAAGEVTGFSGMNQGLGLDIIPSISANRRRNLTMGMDSTSVDPSLDIFYKITPSLNGSLTINTDFSATEVDDRQVNLTRFNLFFPEKRDFFLRDFDVFQFGRISELSSTNTQNTAASPAAKQSGSPFFSRRIGIDRFGMPVDLEYGGKISGRLGGWDLGALTIRQDEAADVDAKSLMAARALREIFDGATIGGIVTSGDPRSNLDNSVIGADFQYLNTRFRGGSTLQAEAWYQQSDTEGLESDDAAYGLGLRMPNRTGFRFGLTLKEIEENFLPAMGFVDRHGVRDRSLELGYTHRRDGRLQSIATGVDAQRVDLLDGGLQSRIVRFRLIELETTTQETFEAFYTSSKEALHEPFEISRGVTLPVGDYSFDEYGFRIGTGTQRNLSGSLLVSDGDFYAGTRLRLEAAALWQPSRRFRTELRYSFNEIELPQGNFSTRLVRYSAEWIFSADLAWTNLVQYDNVSEEVGISSRLQWIPQAGREGFIVLNYNLQDYDRDNSFTSQFSDLVVKFNYTFRY